MNTLVPESGEDLTPAPLPLAAMCTGCVGILGGGWTCWLVFVFFVVRLVGWWGGGGGEVGGGFCCRGGVPPPQPRFPGQSQRGQGACPRRSIRGLKAEEDEDEDEDTPP